MNLHDILRNKGSQVHTIVPDASVENLVDDLVAYNVGSLVVCETDWESGESKMVGIVTERDVLRAEA